MSFGWLSSFRRGAWKELRSFVLNERRDVTQRLDVIKAELTRIGKITVVYAKEYDSVAQTVRVSEQRVGFTVTRNSNLERLLQAYIAMGGNPLNISQFLYPDRSVVLEFDDEGNPQIGSEYPLGGVVYPQTAEPNEPEGSFGAYSGGYIPLNKYKASRTGGRNDTDADSEAFVNYISLLRRPVAQSLRTRVHDLESRIIKQCDLREQLFLEREDLLTQAYGGTLNSMEYFDEDRYSVVLRANRIIDTLDRIFFLDGDDGFPDLDTTNTVALAQYSNLFTDKDPDESTHAL